MTEGVKAETCGMGDSGKEIRLEVLFEANWMKERRGSGKERERAIKELQQTSYNKCHFERALCSPGLFPYCYYYCSWFAVCSHGTISSALVRNKQGPADITVWKAILFIAIYCKQQAAIKHILFSSPQTPIHKSFWTALFTLHSIYKTSLQTPVIKSWKLWNKMQDSEKCSC